jgi:prolyl oligopeptidase PreP (S9A serine peptidase family)
MSWAAGLLGAAQGVQKHWKDNAEALKEQADRDYKTALEDKKATALLDAAKARFTFDTDAAETLATATKDAAGSKTELFVGADGNLIKVREDAEIPAGAKKLSSITNSNTLKVADIKLLQSMQTQLMAVDAYDPTSSLYSEFQNVMDAIKRSSPSLSANPTPPTPPSTLPPASQNEGKAVNVNGNIFESNGSVWTLVVK